MMNRQKLLQLADMALSMPPLPYARFPPSPYYRFLRVLAAELEANFSIELGVCGGGGSYHMAIARPGNQVIGVDLTNDYPDNIKFIQNTCPNFTFVLGDSLSILYQLPQLHLPIDLLFIDTTHTYEQTLAEFNAYSPYLSDKAIVCLDDLFRPRMDKAWDWMPEPKLRLDELHVGGSPTDGGFGVVWK